MSVPKDSEGPCLCIIRTVLLFTWIDNRHTGYCCGQGADEEPICTDRSQFHDGSKKKR